MKTQISTLLGAEPARLLKAAFLGSLLPLGWLLFLILSDLKSFESWMFIPLVIIPSGGAAGGVLFCVVGFEWLSKGNKKIGPIILSTIAYFIVLWMSAVIAFNFTGHWD
ncbi:hypothetical protein GCM10009119_23560 [Algoriphagus jejuensis]|uniref:Uncharacterized protein n=1 Tax=Algoriphagus jejuensis TaxID=419934 RepID=A0ABP3YDF1_9BACT